MIVVYLDVPGYGMGDIGFADKLASAVADHYPDQRVVRVYSIRDLDGPRISKLEQCGFISYQSFATDEPVDLLIEGPVYGKRYLDKFVSARRKPLPHIKMSEYSFDSSDNIDKKVTTGTISIKIRTGLGDDEMGVLVDQIDPESLPSEHKPTDDDTPKLNTPFCGFCYSANRGERGEGSPRDRYRYGRDHMLYTSLRAPGQKVHVRLDFNTTSAAQVSLLSAAMSEGVLGGTHQFIGDSHLPGDRRKVGIIDLSAELRVKRTYTDVVKAINNHVRDISKKKGKHYVSIVLPKLQADVFKRLLLDAGEVVCVTGDQSFIEALQSGKVVSYDCQPWKTDLLKNYLKHMKKCLSKGAYRLVELLNEQNVDFYRFPYRAQLTELLSQPSLIAQIKLCNKEFVEGRSLTESLFKMTDKLMLPARIRAHLLAQIGISVGRDCRSDDVRESIRRFLQAIERKCPRDRSSISIFPSAHRKKVESFILNTSLDCASGSVSSACLPQVFCDQLTELLNSLVSHSSVRTIKCIQEAADEHLLKTDHRHQPTRVEPFRT